MRKGFLPLLGLAAFLVLTPAAKADLYTLNLTDHHGSGPFGTITVTQGINASTVDVSVILTAGDVFAKTGFGEKPIIGFATNKSISFPTVASGFSGDNDWGSFTPFGFFQYTITCDICGNGTSSPRRSSTTFSVYNAAGLTPANFVKNTSGYFWGVDVGVPTQRGGFDSFNVASSVMTPDPSPVPEPGSLYLLMTAGAGCFWVIRKRMQA